MERWSGFETRALELGLDVDGPSSLTPEQLTGDLVERALRTGVTCLIVETAVLAERLAAVVAERGLRVPEDVSVVFLDTGPVAWGEQVSAIGVPREEMGRVAVDLLLALVEEPSTRIESVELRCARPSAATLAPPPAA